MGENRKSLFSLKELTEHLHWDQSLKRAMQREIENDQYNFDENVEVVEENGLRKIITPAGEYIVTGNGASRRMTFLPNPEQVEDIVRNATPTVKKHNKKGK